MLAAEHGADASSTARRRILSRSGEPMFLADWLHVLMIHFEVDAEALQRDVPFQLDLRDGRAFVSLVAFTMENMRPRFGGSLAAWLFKPIASHDFLNVRTYVRHEGETGIHFLAEWLPNWLAVQLGPATFSLPYRYGRICYEHDWGKGRLNGRVTDARTAAKIEFRADSQIGAPFAPCERGSLAEWLMERYTAFDCVRGRKKLFRIWHLPWPQCRVEAILLENTLLTSNWPWFRDVHLAEANFSLGFRAVWMGRPHNVIEHGSKRDS